jgi:hypothetical protein
MRKISAIFRILNGEYGKAGRALICFLFRKKLRK